MKGLWGRRRSMRTIGSSLGTGEGVESGSLLPDFLRDPAIRAYLGNGTYYVGTHEIMGQEVPIVLDMRYLPEGIDGFLNRTYEYQGETPHRTKWDGPKLQKRREMSELWEPDPLQGEAFLAHLDRSFSVGM